MTTQTRPLDWRFWAKVDRQGPVPSYRPELGPCWLWTAALSRVRDGYGLYWDGVRGRQAYAHRWVHEQYTGSIPARWDVDHLCRVTNCVRPSHLEAVTRRENVRRRIQTQAYGTPADECPHGHHLTAVNLYVAPDGRMMYCRPCNRLAARQYRQRKREVA